MLLLQFLVLSWVDDDETIRSEGTQWAFEVTSSADPAGMCLPTLGSLGHIISGRFEDDWGELKLPTETRIRIISSEPFRHLFNWAGSYWLNEWENDFKLFSYILPGYNHHQMKSQALHFANLPANHFDIDQRVSITPLVHSHSLSLPAHDAREGSLPSGSSRVVDNKV